MWQPRSWKHESQTSSLAGPGLEQQGLVYPPALSGGVCVCVLGAPRVRKETSGSQEEASALGQWGALLAGGWPGSQPVVFAGDCQLGIKEPGRLQSSLGVDPAQSPWPAHVGRSTPVCQAKGFPIPFQLEVLGTAPFYPPRQPLGSLKVPLLKAMIPRRAGPESCRGV